MNTILKKFASKAGVIITKAHVLVTTVCLLICLGTLSGSAQIATGTNHALAIQSDGTLWAWGYNYYGQLGDGTTTERTTKVEVQTASGNLSSVTNVSAGANHSLAIDISGNVWAWGYNGNGQLGNGTTINSSKAVQVQTASGNLTGITAVAAGDNFSVALKSDGTVWTVGANSNGQLGIGNTTQQTQAVQVTGLSGIVAISAGATHTMALDASGNVWTWGNNSSGQLGLGSIIQEPTPQEVTSISGIGRIAAGASHSLAMTIQGTTVYAWGLNSNGQLGNNTTTQENSPVTMTGISNAMNVAAGLDHSVILENDGTVWTSGHNYVGELGIGTTVDQHVAVQIPNVGGILAVAARGDRTLMYTNVGTILGVGDDFYSGLGDGNLGYQLSPYSITALTGVTQVSSGTQAYHSLAVKSDGTLWAAGNNSEGQLGNNNLINSNIFVQVTKGSGYLTGVIATAGGAYHSLALTSDNTVWGWGDEAYGQVGNGVTTSYVLQPAQVVTSSGTLTGITAISAGQYHSLALKSDGTVWAWGYNDVGQLGNNTTTNSNKAVEVLNTSGTPLTNIVAISAGELHNLAIDSSGNLWAWGYNSNGQLGDGTIMNRVEAEQISLSGATVTQVAAGGFYSLAVTSTGTVIAMGYNAYGELGDGTTTQRTTPVAVQNLSSVASIAAGQYHSMATETNGSVWTWGFNNNGQLGNGTFDLNNHESPVQISGITSASGSNPGSCGGYHNLLINSSGALTTWANGMYGQLADGLFGYASSPVTAAFTVTQNTTNGLWVDGTHGSDTNPGTFSQPFKTIAAGINQWTSTSDTHTSLTIRGGTYHECIFLDGTYHHMRSGTALNPYVLRGMPGERVIISGMKPIPVSGANWSISSGNIYMTNLGTWNPSTPTPANTFPDTFYMGMNERLMAQQPAPGNQAWIWQSVSTSNGNTIITDTAHLIGVGDLTNGGNFGGYVQMGITQGVQGAVILSNDTTHGTVTIQGTYSNTTGAYVIKNCLQLLTQPGQWACIPQTGGTYLMYYWPENSTEISQLTSSNPPSQARDSYTTGLVTDSAHDQLLLSGVSYVNIQGLEIMGASGAGNAISMVSDTNCNVTGCVCHDNGGYAWVAGEVNEIYGYGVSMVTCTNCTASNNVLTLNSNGVLLQSDTNCTISKNDIGWNYIDGFDVSSHDNLSTPCTNCTISDNYINNQYNSEQHADAIQSYDAGVQGLTVENNVILGQVQSEINGLGSGSFLNNLMWQVNLQNVAGPDTADSLVYNGNIYFDYNTTEQWMTFGDKGVAKPISAAENVICGRLITPFVSYTGNYNLIQPIAQTPTTFDTAQLISVSSTDVWTGWGYLTPAPGAVQDFYAWTGQDQKSQIASTTQSQFVNMPTTIRGVDEVNHMALFSTNTTSTTVPLYQIATTGGGSTGLLGDFAVNDYIEWNMDGIVRQITAINTTNNTITFTPALYGFTPSDGLGYPTLPRNDFVERWGTQTNFARNCTLAPGTPGLTMSPTGGPIGCSLNIGQYQVDDFNGNGIPAVPAIPPDVLANRSVHKWHLATWFSYGNN